MKNIIKNVMGQKSNYKAIDFVKTQAKTNKTSKRGVIIVNCGWDEVEQNNYGFLSECKINADGKTAYYGIHSGHECYNESADHEMYIIYETKEEKKRAIKQAQQILEDLLGIEKFITVHYELEYERRKNEKHHFLAECHVDKNGDSSYYSLKDGTSMGSSYLIEYSLKRAFEYKTEEEKEKAIKQAQEILDSYV